MGARGWRVTTFRPAGIDAPRASDGALSDFGPRERGPAGRADQVAFGRLVDGRGAAAGFTRVKGAPVLVWFELARFVINANRGDPIKVAPVLHTVAAFSPSRACCQGETHLSRRARSHSWHREFRTSISGNDRQKQRVSGSAHDTRRRPSTARINACAPMRSAQDACAVWGAATGAPFVTLSSGPLSAESADTTWGALSLSKGPRQYVLSSRAIGLGQAQAERPGEGLPPRQIRVRAANAAGYARPAKAGMLRAPLLKGDPSMP